MKNTIENTAFTELKQIIARAPQNPGCYLWQDSQKNILYIGKARSLRQRLQNYMRQHPDNIRLLKMLMQSAYVEWIVTATENEALLLEANLIKKHTPRYNVRLKDDKRYPYLCISINEDYPQIYLTRRTNDSHKLYFGPYSDVKATRRTLNLIHKIFPIRKIRQSLPLKTPRRPCINFHIKRCLAPCQNNVNAAEYRKIVDEIILFLEGRTEILENVLQERMRIYSAEQAYEKAAMYRDMLRAVRKVSESQVVQSSSGDEDVLGLACDGNEGQIVLLEIRQGRLIGRKSFALSALRDVPPVEIMEAFVRDYYIQGTHNYVPQVIQIPLHLPNQKLFRQNLRQRLQRNARFYTARAPQAKALSRSAERNAALLLNERLLALQATKQKVALADLRQILNLDQKFAYMECYDISHIQGRATVASSIVFLNGQAQPSAYRHYRLRNMNGIIDDPASMQQVIQRRIQRLQHEGRDLPDLFLIDGGAPQVNAAYAIAQKLQLPQLNFVGLAKRHEELYFPYENQPRCFDADRPGMRLLRRMRNEAHRFAVQFHRRQRQSQVLRHVFDDLKNIGPTRKKALLKHITQYRQAARKPLTKMSVTELSRIPGIGPQIAAQIQTSLAQQNAQRS